MTSPQRVALMVLLALLCSLAPKYPTPAQNRAKEQTPQTGTTPASKPEPAKEKQPDYSQEAVIIEKYKIIHRFEKEGTGRRELTLRVKIQSDAGVQHFGQLVFPYTSANEKFNIDQLHVLKSDGTVVSGSQSDVQDLTAPIAREAPIYTDSRQKHVTVKGLRPGDVLEYAVSWLIETPVAPNHFWLSHDFVSRDVILLDEQLEVNIPADSKVKIKTEPGLEPAIKEQEGRRVYNWKHSNLKRRTKEEEEEARKKKPDSDEPKPPQIQMSTFQSWDEVGKWYAGLERDRVVADEKIRAKAESLVQGLSTDKEKIEALYNFVAKNFRYVSLSLGQGRYQPHLAADVLANQYGDCKDKHTLLAAMLNATGYRAYAALMNSTRKIDPDMPSPGQFDHVISAIPVGAETLWADTTAEVAPFQLLFPPLRDKKALLIPASGPARLETTPAEPPFPSTEVLEVEGQVNDLGKLLGHSRLTLRGDSEILLRTMFRRTPRSDWKNLNFFFSQLSQGEIAELKASEPAATEKPFEVEYDFTNNDYLDWSSKKARLLLPLPALELAHPDADAEEKTKPIKLGAPIKITYRLKLSLPSKYQARAPLPVKVSRDYADYSSTYKLEGNNLIAERSLHLRHRELPAARAQDFRAFVATARADEAQTLSLETTVAGAPSIPESVKVEELITAADAAGKNENYPLAEDLLRRALEKEPKHKVVRRQLGWALFMQHKYDAAIEVLRDQTKINPFDDYAYNLMGQVFWRQQNYSEAEAQFRKQIEISPLDRWAHGNLGQMLVDWRKYKDAVPELEQAISLSPEDESLFLSLGRAYLNLGQTEKALETFDRAIKLDPGPYVWNDVAYFLSLEKVQLDKAQQYAESAVTSVATELRNVDLERLTTEDLNLVASIAAYWDTLGWVHFQKGNLDLAEKYIASAWFLGQHSEVGYHLGQIYEKRGKNEDAIGLYAAAVVGERPVPEPLESLIRFVGKARSEELVKQYSVGKGDLRTVKLGPLARGVKGPTTEAKLFIALVPGPGRKAQIADVKFIDGDEKLRPVSAALKGIAFDFVFPDDSTTKVIRRGTFLCNGPGGECSFIMIQPDFVTLN